MLGKVAVLQSDNRFCAAIMHCRNGGNGSSLLSSYWWKSVRINALWAQRHGYDHVRNYSLRTLRAAPTAASV